MSILKKQNNNLSGIENEFNYRFNKLISDLFSKHNDSRSCHPVKDNRYVVINENGITRTEEVRVLIVHKFETILGDGCSDDALESLMKWLESKDGRWIVRNSVESPTYLQFKDYNIYHYHGIVRAKLSGKALTEWLLRHGE